MPKTLASEPSRNTIDPALLALTPRQLLITRPVMAKESKAPSLKSEQKALLLRSIAQYLDRCGFSKCFKKLLSEAEIEKKELNSALLPDLEEVYGVFLNKSNLEAVEVKDENASDQVKKEKKKKKVEVTKEEKVKETDAEIEDGVKEKKKKKKEPKVEVTKEEKVKEADGEIEDGVKEKKKKKKNKSKADDEEKVSKKRKRSEPEEETREQTEDDEESKRRKKEDDMGVQETPLKQNDVEENNGDVETANKKSGKGLSDSKEPKKPFQRVNVEEVVFTDDRLKDNSYWAKGGADSGYGAKAQEVLGQVKGRGFRHEKTKKKRGSYRGGEIDLQSHSVKFEYSDDE